MCDTLRQILPSPVATAENTHFAPVWTQRRTEQRERGLQTF